MTTIRKLWKENICYKALLLILLLLMLVPYLHQELAPLAKIFLIWGYGYIIYDFVTGRTLWKRRSLFLLLGFCACYAVTIFLNRETAFTTNLKALLYMSMLFILLCGSRRTEQNKETDRGEMLRREITILTRTMLVVTFLLSLVCLMTFLLNLSGQYPLADGSLAYLGMIDGRLWGLYNANTGGALNAISVVTILFALQVQKDTGRAFWKAFYLISLVVHVSCLSLSGSRTALLALLAVLSIAVYLWMPMEHWVKRKRKPGRVRLFLLRVLAAIIIFMAGYAVCALTGALFHAIPRGEVQRITITREHREENAAAETNAQESANGKIDEGMETGAAGSAGDIIAEAPSENTETEVPSGEITSPVRTDGGVLTGRPILWRAGLQTFEKHPLFGVTREKLVPVTVPELSNPAWEPDLTAGGVHNGYLTVLICSGITGTACLLAYVVVNVCNFRKAAAAKKQRKPKKDSIPTLRKGAIALLLLFLIMELMEARVLYQINFFLFLFWLIVGYLTADGEDAYEKSL